MTYTITSSLTPLGAGLYATAEEAAAAVSARLLRGQELEPGLRITEIVPDAGLDASNRRSRANASVLSAAASGVAACEHLAREGQLATARQCAHAFRAILAAAGLASIEDVRGAAVVVAEEIRGAKRPDPTPEPEPELEPEEVEPDPTPIER